MRGYLEEGEAGKSSYNANYDENDNSSSKIMLIMRKMITAVAAHRQYSLHFP